MRQLAQVIQVPRPGYAEVKVRRASACAGAHNCGSCDHCSFMENAPEIVVMAKNPRGARTGDTVVVETATANILGAAMLVYIVPFILFFCGYALGFGFHWPESGAIALGGLGFLLGLFCAGALDRYWRKHKTVTFQIVSIEG